MQHCFDNVMPEVFDHAKEVGVSVTKAMKWDGYAENRTRGNIAPALTFHLFPMVDCNGALRYATRILRCI
jgi:hypothetical protein